jgi:hypothetical protein
VTTTASPTISQAAIVATKAPAEQPITTAMIDALFTELEAAGFSRPDIRAVLGGLIVGWGPELARLRRIEATAREVLASGQAQYQRMNATDDGWIGDFVPAGAIVALKWAVVARAETFAQLVPPAAAADPASARVLAPAAADDLDDDGCPVGDPDCDLPADSLHEWCGEPGNEERTP